MPPTKKLKILFVTSEVAPFMKAGGLADVSAALPQMLQELGHQVRIIVPKYGAIDEKKFKIHEVVRLKDIKTKIGENDVKFSLRSSFLVSSKTRVQIYFVDNYEYFGSRHSLYQDPIYNEDFKDNDERFILLTHAVFELINKLNWVPDIIHSNDWQCGLVPAYFKLLYKNNPLFKDIKTIHTIHNLAFQGVFPRASIAKTQLPKEIVETETGVLQKGKFNFMKAAIQYSDILSTVSPSYANEICTDKDISCGLGEFLCSRKNDMIGIINGIDNEVWNPKEDELIPARFGLKNIDNKKQNKIDLAEKFNLQYKPDVPIISMISRLHESKGFDLIVKSFTELMELDIQLILLGTGEREFHRFFEDALFDYGDKFACYLGFDDELAHLIEAGSDMFLMPSKFEACGLNQMYSLMYGTVPIVRETGGLADTVIKFNEKTGEGNGFSFKRYDTKSLISEINRAIKIYKNKPEDWKKIIKSGMNSDFSWLNSAKHYIELYKKLLLKS